MVRKEQLKPQSFSFKRNNFYRAINYEYIDYEKV